MIEEHRRRAPLAVFAVALVLAGAACAAPSGAAAPALPALLPLSLPAPTGPQPIGTSELHLVGPNRTDPWDGRPREVMASVWYPAAPGADGPRAPYLSPGAAAFYDRTSEPFGIRPGSVDFSGASTHAVEDAPVATEAARLPVVLYSPGRGQSRAMGTTLVEELASHGYAVIAIDHTFAGPVQLPDRVVEPAARPDMVLMTQERVADVRFVLDAVAAGDGLPAGLRKALDLTRVGIFGHSAGGFTAAEAMLTEERIDAGANLDGSMPPEYGAAASQGVSRPFLLMGGGTSGEAGLPHDHVSSPDWNAFWQHSTGWELDLHLAAAEHMSFSDLQVLLPQIDQARPLAEGVREQAIGTVDPARSLAAQRAYVTAFFDLHLRDLPSPLLDGESPAHPDMRFVR